MSTPFIYNNSEGEIWTGGEMGITHISVEDDLRIKFHNYMADLNGEVTPLFRDLFEGVNGSVWAVSDQGLYEGDPAHHALVINENYELKIKIDVPDQNWLQAGSVSADEVPVQEG